MDLITVTRRRGLEFNIHVRGHDVSSDMSVHDGGEDASFSPSELFAGSLGACIAMMVQGYCDRHGYVDGDVGVSLTLEYADEPKRVGAVVVDIELPPSVPKEQWGVVRRIAERCTIHETLHHPPRVDIEVM